MARVPGDFRWGMSASGAFWHAQVLPVSASALFPPLAATAPALGGLQEGFHGYSRAVPCLYKNAHGRKIQRW